MKKCYQCHKDIEPGEETRVIGTVIEVCMPCYRELKQLILLGYWDVPTLEDGMIEEAEVQTHLSALA